jgi:type IV pilus assembly protein PilV
MSIGKRARRERGVSIIEALVALLVLSIGMLGIAVMYLESVRANRAALSRTLAIHLVNDMADRIRANRAAGKKYELASGTAPTTPPVNCAANDCTAENLAAYDLNQWYTAVMDTLPKGANGGTDPLVTITYDPGATSNDPGRYTIVTEWKEAGSNDSLTTKLEFTQIGNT